MAPSVKQPPNDSAAVAQKTVETAEESPENTKPNAKPGQGEGKDASAPVNYLVWQDQKLPCIVRVAVFENGLAAGLGIKSLDDEFMAGLLGDPNVEPLIRELVRQQINAEFSRREISSGIIEEEVLGGIDDFVKNVLDRTGKMATRRVAEGQAPEPGVDAKLVYVLQVNGEPLHRMLPADRKLAEKKMHRIKPGDVLVERLAPEAGTEGGDVRGEVVAVTEPRDVVLSKVKGPNTDVKGDKIVSAILGVYREDEEGRVQAVQEVVSDEVNASTGNLPRTGVATSNFLIKKGIRQGLTVLTTGDVLIGQLIQPGSVDKNTQVNARSSSQLAVIVPGDASNCRHNIIMDHNDLKGKLLLSHRITGRAGETVALLLASVNSDEVLEPIMHIGRGFGKTGEVVLVNQDRMILTQLKHPLANGFVPRSLEYQMMSRPSELAASGQEGFVEAEDYRGKWVLAAYRYIPMGVGLGWGVVVKQDEVELTADLKE
ncbi:MAG: DUF342 domain-containing protein, partial [Candidatus Latescibacteria bacterium]|nr:DUF342 domain-containing protein [Candidatus Latescibacterota bacterium]